MKLKSKWSADLYKVHSTGKIGTWSVRVDELPDGSGRITITSCKIIGGKPVVKIKNVTEGKNIGRSNETTPSEQALKEGIARYEKQLKKGYVEEMPKEGDKALNQLGYTFPMLAKEYSKWSKGRKYVQPKLDGHRMKATVDDDGKVVLYSKGGNLINLDHLQNLYQRAYDLKLWDGTPLDGELYIHDMVLEDISSLAKRQQPGSEKLIHHVYDAVLEANFPERLAFLFQTVSCIMAHIGEDSPIALVDTFQVVTEDRLNKLHAKFVQKGYEGSMVRIPEGHYEDGKRSSNLLKKKDFQDAEFTIVAVEKGVPNIREDATYEVAIYTCITEDGKEFTVTAPGDMYAKHAAYINSKDAIGKPLTVKYFNFTSEGIPYLPIALRIREDL